MSKVKLYIARHGKTMFNTIGRVQGWSDSPLTPFGEEGIRELGVGLKAAGIPFKSAYSSDSGRTIQTMDIILRETGLETIPYKRDKRIREWCFGSFDGGYDLERSGGGDAFVVSHSMTIATFAWLMDPSVEHPPLDNGSVTVVAYENGRFTLETLGDMTYRQVGREIIEKDNGKK